MDPILIYYIKINIGIILFYGFYKLFFTRDTLFKMRRTALITFFAVAFIYPLMNIETWMRNFWEVDESIVTYNLIMSEFSISAPVDNTPFYGTWDNLVIIILLGGIFVLSGRLITDLIRIGLLRRNSEIISVQGIQCYRLSGDQAPFSFFRSIFINPDCHTAAEQQEIITHELSHARQHHSVDVIISEVACIALWINPFAWLLAREIRQNLEYLADQHVIEAGFNPKNYQYHLLGLTYTKAAAKLYNNFNVLPLKNRIRMMNKKRTSRAFSVKYALFAPLAFALLFVSNIELIAREANNWMETPTIPAQESMINQKEITTEQATPEVTRDAQEKVPVKKTEDIKKQEKGISDLKGKVASVSLPQDKKADPQTQTFTVVEDMPKFPGGDKALLQFLRDNVKYPEAEAKKGIQGRVIISFIISKEGKVTNPTVVRGVDPALDNEALRVINAMPLWTPGIQRGVPVNVKYTVPVNFRLNKDGKPDLSYPDRKTIDLIVLDGKEYTRAQFDEIAKGKDPKWIESVNVLKPEEAIKLYGEKAKDGVIVITTKK